MERGRTEGRSRAAGGGLGTRGLLVGLKLSDEKIVLARERLDGEAQALDEGVVARRAEDVGLLADANFSSWSPTSLMCLASRPRSASSFFLAAAVVRLYCLAALPSGPGEAAREAHC